MPVVNFQSHLIRKRWNPCQQRVLSLTPAPAIVLLKPWAETAQFAQVLEYGCRIWIMPGPFTHTKLMLVDGIWTMLGSANWDARSLRLNFEFNIECYDVALAASLESSLKENFAKAEQMHRLGRPVQPKWGYLFFAWRYKGDSARVKRMTSSPP